VVKVERDFRKEVLNSMQSAAQHYSTNLHCTVMFLFSYNFAAFVLPYFSTNNILKVNICSKRWNSRQRFDML
jgi:hypothetical protein